MSEKSVLLVEDEEILCENLELFINDHPDYQVVGTADNGLDALRLIEEKEPDVLVLDIMMPYLDGIGVLEELRTKNYFREMIIVIISSVWQHNIKQKLLELGAAFCIMKPFSPDILVRRIEILTEQIAIKENSEVLPSSLNHSLLIKATDIMHQAGIPANVKGYFYLRYGILLAVNEIDILGSMTKELYPMIAEKFRTSPQCVERAIRHAIGLCATKSNEYFFQKLFGNSMDLNKKRPTNSQFIAKIVDQIRLDLNIAQI